MAEVVYVLGAGFNRSILDRTRGRAAPLARNFFQIFMADPKFADGLDGFRQHVYVDILFEEIERYWRLDLDGLRNQPFDIEECLTLFESQAADTPDADRKLRLARASFALRQMLLTYLADISHEGHTPAGRQFGQEVLASGADVLTFNYDTLAETEIASASGVGPKPMPDSLRGRPDETTLAEPIVIPPMLYKPFNEHPFPVIWDAALQTLSECQTLVVIGYSFPPTDFRTRRLFLEAFSEHSPRSVVVVNPDPGVVRTIRELTHFNGAVVSCDDLPSLYGLPQSWFDFAEAMKPEPGATAQSGPSPSASPPSR